MTRVGDPVVLLADDVRLEDRRRRVERVHRRVDALLGDRPREHRRGVEVGEHRGGRRVGEVVGRDVDRLHRGHRAVARRGDALLQLAHLRLQRRLVADLGGHAAEERGDLRAGLDEPEDVVDEEQHVLAADVAEVLRHRQAGQRHAHARAGRLVHLAEDEHRLVDDARLLHLQPEVVALAGALADAAEGGQAAVLLGEVVDELLDEDRLADAGAAEQADLAALGVGREEVDDLDAGLEHLLRRREVLDVRGGPVDRPALLDLELARRGRSVSPRTLKMRPSVMSPTGTVIGPPVSTTSTPRARPSVRVHGDRADAVVAEVLLHLEDEVVLALAGDGERAVDLGEVLGEHGLDDDALDLLDLADVGRAAAGVLLLCLDCCSASFVRLGRPRPSDDV